MTNFLCTRCGVILKNRGHKCGVLDTIHHVELVKGGTSWGKSTIGGRDNSCK